MQEERRAQLPKHQEALRSAMAQVQALSLQCCPLWRHPFSVTAPPSAPLRQHAAAAGVMSHFQFRTSPSEAGLHEPASMLGRLLHCPQSALPANGSKLQQHWLLCRPQRGFSTTEPRPGGWCASPGKHSQVSRACCLLLLPCCLCSPRGRVPGDSEDVVRPCAEPACVCPQCIAGS